MGLRINTNVGSLRTQRNITEVSEKIERSTARLSSGNRIASAKDDAAGLAISSNLNAHLRGLQQAQRNANDGVSLVQTAEGGLNEVSNILVRLRELSVQAASDTVGDTERGYINKEYATMKQEIDRLAQVTEFNGKKLLDGSGDQIAVQVGAHAGEANRITYDMKSSDIRTDTLGITSTGVSNKDDALDSMEKIDNAINQVNNYRATIGASQNQLHSASSSLGLAFENISEAKSRISDADVASEVSELVKNTVIQNAGISVLAQANTAINGVLKLL